MTIEEAIRVLQHHKPNDIDNAYKVGEAISVLIKALENLDKIRSDIDYELHEAPYHYDDDHLIELYGYQDGLEKALSIIDKHFKGA